MADEKLEAAERLLVELLRAHAPPKRRGGLAALYRKLLAPAQPLTPGAPALAWPKPLLQAPPTQLSAAPLIITRHDLRPLRALVADAAVARRSLRALAQTQLAVSARSLATRAAHVPLELWRKAVLSITRQKRRQDLLQRVLDRGFFQPAPDALDLLSTQAAAIRVRLGQLWERSVPFGGDTRSALREVFERMRQLEASTGEFNRATFVREELFSPWRDRFMLNLIHDAELTRLLRQQLGLRVVWKEFRGVRYAGFEMWDGAVWNGVDIDHAMVNLAEAAHSATHADDLGSIVSADNLRLMVPRQNSVEIERLKRLERAVLQATEQDFVDASGLRSLLVDEELLEEVVAAIAGHMK